MVKEKLIKSLIDFFFEIEGIKVEKLDELSLSTRKQFITKLHKLENFLASLVYFIDLTLPSDNRFLRLSYHDNIGKLLIPRVKIEDWAFKDFPYLKANKKFLQALNWLFEVADKENVELKVIRGFVPWVRTQAFSWTYRKVATHSRGKGADIIIPNTTPDVTLHTLRQILAKIPSWPFSLVFIEDVDGVHVNFAPFQTKKRFFSLTDYRYKPCAEIQPSEYLKLLWAIHNTSTTIANQ